MFFVTAGVRPFCRVDAFVLVADSFRMRGHIQMRTRLRLRPGISASCYRAVQEAAAHSRTCLHSDSADYAA